MPYNEVKFKRRKIGMKRPKGIKEKLKLLKEPILEELEKERKYQLDLRNILRESEDDEELKRTKKLYDESVEYCKVLIKSLAEYEKLSENKWKINLDTLMVVAGNLFGILLILNFEKMDIVRSKAFSLLLKGRV